MLHTNKDNPTTMITRARRNTLGDLLTRTAVKYPEKWAFTYKSRKVTYKELDDLVNQTAHGLIQDGITKGNRLAILSKNSLDFVITLFAVARIGAVLIPINYMLKEKDISYILQHANVKGLFAAEEYTTILEKAAKGVMLSHKSILVSMSVVYLTVKWKIGMYLYMLCHFIIVHSYMYF